MKPTAIVQSRYGDPEAFGERWLEVVADIQQMPYGTKLYTISADQVLVSREWLSTLIGEISHGWGASFEESEIAEQIRALLHP